MPNVLQKKKEDKFEKDAKRYIEYMAAPDRPRLVGEVATALGLSAKQYDAYGLVHNLPGTGGEVKPGTAREMILTEMRTRGVANPETQIDSPATAMVKLQILSNPGDAKNDYLDVSVANSDDSIASDLREGYVLPARLKELLFVKGQIRTSSDKAEAKGDVLIFPASYMKQEKLDPLKGVIIGGGRLLESPTLGLQIDNDFRHVKLSKALEQAINSRFYFKESGRQKMVAQGKNDWLILIDIVPKYRWDPAHYMSVVMSLGFSESPEQVQERTAGCKKLLADRVTARRAASELEGINTKAAQDILISGLSSPDTEIRFYSAYSLAYMDRVESIPVLLELAKNEPAFRPLCLVGLSVNDTAESREALEMLLQEREPELRFGAYWSIRQRNPNDAILRGEAIGELCNFVQIPSSLPLVAVSLQEKREVVMYGNQTAVTLIGPIEPTPSIKMSPMGPNQIQIIKRHGSGETFRANVSSDIVSILRGIVSVDGNYGDIVHTIETLSQSNLMSSPVAMNPRPRAGRVYVRPEGDSGDGKDPNLIEMEHVSAKSKEEKAAWWSLSSWWNKSNNKTDSEQPTESKIDNMRLEVNGDL